MAELVLKCSILQAAVKVSYGAWAIPTFSPIGSWSSSGRKMCVLCTGIVQNELICGHANIVDTSSLFCPHIHTHACIVMPSGDGELMGLKVDITCACPCCC